MEPRVNHTIHHQRYYFDLTFSPFDSHSIKQDKVTPLIKSLQFLLEFSCSAMTQEIKITPVTSQNSQKLILLFVLQLSQGPFLVEATNGCEVSSRKNTLTYQPKKRNYLI